MRKNVDRTVLPPHDPATAGAGRLIPLVITVIGSKANVVERTLLETFPEAKVITPAFERPDRIEALLVLVRGPDEAARVKTVRDAAGVVWRAEAEDTLAGGAMEIRETDAMIYVSKSSHQQRIAISRAVKGALERRSAPIAWKLPAEEAAAEYARGFAAGELEERARHPESLVIVTSSTGTEASGAPTGTVVVG